MPVEPGNKRAIAFFDGQNLFYAAKQAFGYNWPNYDPLKLAQIVCGQQGWQLVETRFYTGVPRMEDNLRWNAFWTSKLSSMSRAGIQTFSRPLKYRNQTVQIPGTNNATTILVGSEKGIDVRIALDVVKAAFNQTCDVLLVFSQDQDLTEVADEVRMIAKQQSRWIKIASAFPASPTSTNMRGINKSEWIRIDRATYDNALDHRDYRPSP